MDIYARTRDSIGTQGVSGEEGVDWGAGERGGGAGEGCTCGCMMWVYVCAFVGMFSCITHQFNLCL